MILEQSRTIRNLRHFIILCLFKTLCVYGQDTPKNLKKHSYEFNVGYANFDENFNGAFLDAGYNYHFNKFLMAQGHIGFELGKTSFNDGMGEDKYNTGILAIGPTVKLPVSNNHEIRLGGEFGLMLLIINHRDISSNNLLYPHVFGLSGSYIYKLNKKIELGLAYTYQKINPFGFSNNKIGIVFVLKPIR